MRVMTWNLWWRFGPWAERQKAILAVLRETGADVVGLQEVWAADGENLAEWLAGELGLHWTWAPSLASDRWQRRIGRPGVEVGNAVLSRWPVVEQDVLRLPAPEEADDGRLALYARVDAPGHQLPFFTVHLSSQLHFSALRGRQVTALAEFVAAHRAGTDFPPVVTGDFNAPPDSDEIRRFSGTKTAPVVPRQVFFDAWDYADPSAPSTTWDHTNPYVHPGLGPSTRIDYIHVGAPAGPGGIGTVRAVRRTGHGPVDGVWPSDHAAVVADLQSVSDDPETPSS